MTDETAGDVPYAMGGRKRGSLFSKFSAKPEPETPPAAAQQAARPVPAPPVAETPAAPAQSAPHNDYSMQPRPAAATASRMTVPKDVEITGAINSRSETDIAGTVDGDVTVEAPLLLAQGSKITGKVKAKRCRLDGRVEGGVECTEDLEIGPSGQLNADALAGNNIRVAGEINGSIRCSGKLHLAATARITGDIRARSLVVEDGALFNGACAMSSQKAK